MQPYFDPTKKMNSNKNGRSPQNKTKEEADLQKKMEANLHLFFDKLECKPQKNGRRPQKQNENGRRPKKKWKMT
jgi:hypothetical protein